MADISETRQLTNPLLEGSLSAFLKSIDKLGAGAVPTNFTGINTAAYAPQIAAQNTLQTGAQTAAGGLGSLTGPDAYKPYMSPYQQEVMDTTMAEFDRNAAVQNVGLRDNAISRGAYGGGREGVMAAEALRGNNMNRAQLQAQLLNQGFQQAQQAAGTDLAAQQGLGGYQQQIGQAQQGYQQAILDADQVAAREAQYQPFTQMGLIGQQLAQVTPGAFPTQTVGYQPAAAPVSPLQSFIGGAGTAGGILGKLLG